MKSIGIVLNVDLDQGNDKGSLCLLQLNESKPKPSSQMSSPRNKDQQLVQMVESSANLKRKLPMPFFSDTQTETSYSCKKRKTDLIVQKDALFVDWSNMSSLNNREGSGLQMTVDNYKKETLESQKIKQSNSFEINVE